VAILPARLGALGEMGLGGTGLGWLLRGRWSASICRVGLRMAGSMSGGRGVNCSKSSAPSESLISEKGSSDDDISSDIDG